MLEATYTRTAGRPNVYTDQFLGAAGTATLVIHNGGGEFGRVSSAIVWLNDRQILGPKHFNQRVEQIELGVSLLAQNELSVELRGGPGGALHLQVVQQISSDAASVIGPAGGAIEVVDPDSVAYGTRVDMPPHALTGPALTTITASLSATTGLASLEAAGFVPIGPEIDVQLSGSSLVAPVVLTIPYDESQVPSIVPELMLHVVRVGEHVEDIDDIEPLSIDPERNEISVQLTHLSRYRVVTPPGIHVLPFQWDVDELTYYIADDTLGYLWGRETGTDLKNVVSSAVESWSPHQGRFVIRQVQSEDDANLVLRPVADLFGVFAHTYVCSFCPRTFTADDRVTIDFESSAEAYDGYYASDVVRGLTTVVRHEVGHALGLAHHPADTSTAEPHGVPAMWIAGSLFGDPYEDLERTLTGDDIAALQSKYGVPDTGPGPVVTVVLTSPFPGTVFTGPVSIAVEARVVVTGGTVRRVDFFSGAALIGSAAAEPYAITWTDVPAGSYTLTAVAVDSRGATTTSAPVSIAVTAGGATLGTLGMPIATPPSGVYRPPQAIVLTAAVGTTIHYTLDGSEPTPASPVYTGPLTIATDTALRARAFQVGWTPSPVLDQTYTFDSEPPVITPTLMPVPNALGWHNTDVTITFTCTDSGSGMGHCPEPMVIATEGANQSVTAAAQDLVGNVATATVTVSLDKTPPIVTLAAPSDGSLAAGPTVSASGTATDDLSGLAGAFCNGRPAALSGDVVTCDVPVRPGRNAVIVHATDRAGNSGSAGATVRVLGTRVTVSPTRFTLLVGETRVMTVTDEGGHPLDGAIWTTRDPTIAAISLEDGRTLQALAAGETTVTATVDGVSAEAQVTVLAGASLPPGTVEWAADPPLGFTSGGVVYTHRTDPEVPDLYALQYGGEAWWHVTYRGLTARGEVARLEVPPVGATEYVMKTMGETFGGLVVATEGYVWDGRTWALRTAIMRFAGPPGVRPWRYDSPGQLDPEIAQGADGTIYALQMDGAFPQIVVLDGETGLVKRRVSLPHSFSTTLNLDCIDGWNLFWESGAGVGPLSVGADGTAYAEVLIQQDFFNYLPCGAGSGRVSHQLRLLAVTPDGTSTLQPLHEYTSRQVFVTLEQVVPDSEGGMLASWYTSQWEGSGWVRALHGAYVREGGVTEYTLPAPGGAGHLMLAGEAGRGYLSGYASGSYDSVTAFDLATGAVRWTAAVADYAVPIAALAGGGVAVRGYSGALTIIDGTGTVTGAGSLPISNPQYWGPGFIGESAGAVESVAAPSLQLAWYEYAVGIGSRQRQAAGVQCPCGPTRWRSKLGIVAPRTAPTTRVHYHFDPSVPADIMRIIDEQADEWNDLLAQVSPVVRLQYAAFTGYRILVDPRLIGARGETSYKDQLIRLRPDLVNDIPLLRYVVLHELGHALAFSHSECGPETSVMYPDATKVRLPGGVFDYLQSPTDADKCAIRRDFSTGSQGDDNDCPEDPGSTQAAWLQDGRRLHGSPYRAQAEPVLGQTRRPAGIAPPSSSVRVLGSGPRIASPVRADEILLSWVPAGARDWGLSCSRGDACAES